MLVLRSEGGRFFIYENSTTPWLLVDAFDSEEDARIYLSYRRPGSIILRHFPWAIAVLQEDSAKCSVCKAYLPPGSEVFVKTTQSQFNTNSLRNHHEFKCLHHIPTRFERINGDE